MLEQQGNLLTKLNKELKEWTNRGDTEEPTNHGQKWEISRLQDEGGHIWNEYSTSKHLFILHFFFMQKVIKHNLKETLSKKIGFPSTLKDAGIMNVHWHTPEYLNYLYNKVHFHLQKVNKTLSLNKFPFYLTYWEVQPGLWFVTALPCDVGLITLQNPAMFTDQ